MSAEFSLPSFPRLETERLLLREATPEDGEAIFAVFSDPAVTQFHDLATFTSIEKALGVIERRAKRFESGRGIRWGMGLRLVVASVMLDNIACDAPTPTASGMV